MNVLFYASSAVAIIAAIMVVTRANVMHALMNLVLAFLAIACIFWTLGAPFVAALQIVIYAGAIIVLFVFVVMILNTGVHEQRREQGWLSGAVWVMPVILAAVLMALFLQALAVRHHQLSLIPPPNSPVVVVGPKAVGISLFSDYLLGVELASALLLAALVAAFRFGGFLARLESDNE